MTEVTALILAGGQSSRMGQDKALLMVNGSPLLHQICTIAQSCVEQVYVITPWGDRYRSILPATCQLIPEHPLPQESAPHGPLVGFAQGLAQISHPWVLLLACDLPRLSVAGLQDAIAQRSSVPSEAIALLPRDERGWQPLCGLYKRQCVDSLNRFIEQGGRSFQGWLAGETVAELQLSDPEMVFNCNTPEDAQRLMG